MSYRCNHLTVYKNGVPSRECLHNRVAHYRKLKGMTQTDLGKAVGLSKASISKLENHCNGTTAYVALKICRVLGCKFEECFTIL